MPYQFYILENPTEDRKITINKGDTITFAVDEFSSSISAHHTGTLRKGSESEIIYENILVSKYKSLRCQHTFTDEGIYTLENTSVEYSGSLTATITVTIPTNYNLEFSMSNYMACNGEVTVEAILTNNNEPVNEETITLRGIGSTLTSTTNADGVATFNITNINEDKTITITFEEETATATIQYINPSTLNGALLCLANRLVTNLNTMGVTGISVEDGLTSLADEILNIPSNEENNNG